MFAERGFAGTALRDVAERVGVRTPSLYNHFASKESLYAAVLERWIAPAFARGLELALGGRFEGPQVPHLVLAMYHVVVGYFTSASLYAQLTGEDALSDAALERQTRFLRELVLLLFPDEAPGTP